MHLEFQVLCPYYWGQKEFWLGLAYSLQAHWVTLVQLNFEKILQNEFFDLEKTSFSIVDIWVVENILARVWLYSISPSVFRCFWQTDETKLEFIETANWFGPSWRSIRKYYFCQTRSSNKLSAFAIFFPDVDSNKIFPGGCLLYWYSKPICLKFSVQLPNFARLSNWIFGCTCLRIRCFVKDGWILVVQACSESSNK